MCIRTRTKLRRLLQSPQSGDQIPEVEEDEVLNSERSSIFVKVAESGDSHNAGERYYMTMQVMQTENKDDRSPQPDIALLIKSLQEDSLQISELTEMEQSYTLEVATHFKQLIEQLNRSFHLKPATISKSDNSIEDVIITPQGLVCVTLVGGKISSKPLESLPGEMMLKILAEVVPSITQTLTEKRQKLTTRVEMLEVIAREIRKTAPVAAGSGRQQKSSLVSQDAIRAALPAMMTENHQKTA